MAKQSVTFIVPALHLGNADIKILARWDDELLGTLSISKGGIAWRGPKAKKAIRRNWAQVAKMIKRNKR